MRALCTALTPGMQALPPARPALHFGICIHSGTNLTNLLAHSTSHASTSWTPLWLAEGPARAAAQQLKDAIDASIAAGADWVQTPTLEQVWMRDRPRPRLQQPCSLSGTSCAPLSAWCAHCVVFTTRTVLLPLASPVERSQLLHHQVCMPFLALRLLARLQASALQELALLHDHFDGLALGMELPGCYNPRCLLSLGWTVSESKMATKLCWGCRAARCGRC